MSVNARQPQRKPSGQERTIRQIIHDREERIVGEGIVVRVFDYLFTHPGYGNSNRAIAREICCGSTTIDRLVREYVDHGRESTLGWEALRRGYILSKKKIGSYWRIAVAPYRAAPIYLDDSLAEAQALMVPGADLIIHDVAEFYRTQEQPRPRDRPDLKGLTADQQLDADTAYGSWEDDTGADL